MPANWGFRQPESFQPGLERQLDCDVKILASQGLDALNNLAPECLECVCDIITSKPEEILEKIIESPVGDELGRRS